MRRFIPSCLREFFAPITIRFFKTEDLLDTMGAMEVLLERPLIERSEHTDEIAMKMQMLIGRELLRRKVRFWEEF